MIPDVEIRGRKEKKESTVLRYSHLNKAQIRGQARERKRERIRVNRILTNTYYSNIKETKYEK